MTVFSNVFELRLPSQRIWVDCSGSKTSEELDRVCKLFLKQGISVAVLDDFPGALISNVSNLENLWLPQACRRDLSMSLFQGQISDLIETLSPMLPDMYPDLRDLLSRRPGQLSTEQCRLVILMRTVLMNPEFVLLSPAWISGLADSFGQVLLRMMHSLLPRATWLAFDEIEPIVVGLSTGWARTQLLSL